MPAKNLKVAVDKSTTAVLVALAQKENKPVAHVAEELILEAIEYREDKALSVVGEHRDRDSVKSKKVKHDEKMAKK